MICLKISTFVVPTTTWCRNTIVIKSLWFAWKYLPLWYQQQPKAQKAALAASCDLLENIYLCGTNNNLWHNEWNLFSLWFAWKYLPLWYQQQLKPKETMVVGVVICLKISTFVVPTTTQNEDPQWDEQLWFAWKYLPLWYQQQPKRTFNVIIASCDLLENIYLCGINNNSFLIYLFFIIVVICLKISTFVVSTTT